MRCWSPRMSLRVYKYPEGFSSLLRGRAYTHTVNAMAASAKPCPSFVLLPGNSECTKTGRPLICRASLSSFSFSGKRLSVEARPPCTSSRFISFISVAPGLASRKCSSCALDPDYYRVQKEEGIPVGVRLKIWNLPTQFDTEEFKAWFGPPDVVNPVHVDKVILTDEPVWNDQNIRAFVDFVTIDDACMAIVKYDGSRFNGRCIRMDFVQKRPHEKEYGGPRSRGYRSNPSGIRRNPNSSYASSYANPNYGAPATPGSTGDAQPGSPPAYGNPDLQPNFAPAGGGNMENTEPRPNYGPGYGAPPRPSSMNRIFVGNLPWSTDDMALQQMFGQFGSVLEARIVRDRDTGRSRGFGFISMSTPEEMNAAISAMSGKLVEGRTLTVNEAASRV